MFIVTISSLVMLIRRNLMNGNWLLVVLSAVLLALAVFQLREAWEKLFSRTLRTKRSA